MILLTAFRSSTGSVFIRPGEQWMGNCQMWSATKLVLVEEEANALRRSLSSETAWKLKNLLYKNEYCSKHECNRQRTAALQLQSKQSRLWKLSCVHQLRIVYSLKFFWNDFIPTQSKRYSFYCHQVPVPTVCFCMRSEQVAFIPQSA